MAYGKAAMRLILVLHRYLGVAVGLLMTLWCLSGFVMMYQSFPALTVEERVRGLEPLRLQQCCNFVGIDLEDEDAVTGFQIEMLAGEPVLRLSPDLGIYRLQSGTWLQEALTPAEVSAVARAYGEGAGIQGPPAASRLIEIDQWTVGSARRNQPVHHVRFEDPAGSEIYISGATGQVFQDTNRRERVLSWFGAVPHWLYPTQLRQNGPLWTNIVVWSSIVGVFLTVTGLYVGVVRFKRRASGRWSPYRGLWYWHHLAGLVFGILTLTWVFSGLMTMGPWNVLASSAGQVRATVTGYTTWGEVSRLLAAAPTLADPQTVQIRSVPLGGDLRAIALSSDSSIQRRVDSAGAPTPFSQEDIRLAVGRAGLSLQSLDRLDREDSYYYGHHRTVKLPVYRAILDDPGRTHLYFDHESGVIAQAVDRPARTRRWVETGLHDLDFAWLRRRPVWDLVVLPLLAGVTLVCATGTWLGFRRLRQDFAGIRQRRRRAPDRRPVS